MACWESFSNIVGAQDSYRYRLHLRNHIGRTLGCCGHRPNPMVANNTYR